jgi:hypothetical protein
MAFSIGSELVYKVALENADSGDKRSQPLSTGCTEADDM